MSVGSESTIIFRRVIDGGEEPMPPDLARYLARLDFPAADHARFEDLSEKAQDGTLTAEEAEELDGYLHVDSLLAIMRLRANRSLRQDEGEAPHG